MSARNSDAHGSTALHRGHSWCPNEFRWGASQWELPRPAGPVGGGVLGRLPEHRERGGRREVRAAVAVDDEAEVAGRGGAGQRVLERRRRRDPAKSLTEPRPCR